MEDGKPLSAKEKRQEQIKRWENSATDLECATYANPKVRVKFDDGAVFLAACSARDLDEVKALLDNGADINFANVDGLTALHQACIDGNLEVVKFLVEHGSEIDQEDNEGWTPLHATASCGFMEIAKYLVEKGANVGAVNSEAELAIDTAEDDDMIDYLQSEIDRQGIDVEKAKNIERLVMLEDANTLLERYQNGEELELYRHPKSGASFLHIAAAKGYNDVMRILIKAGLDVNATDNDGWTPLHAASHWSQEESAKILADKNANFKARSKLGQTCFDVADEDMLEYLEELESEQEKKDPIIKEPPPAKIPRTTADTDSIKINDIPNGEKPYTKPEETSDTITEQEETVKSKKISSIRPASTSDLKSYRDRVSSDDTGDRLTRRNRPSSLQISSQEQSSHRPLTGSNSEGGLRLVAATQPVQSLTRNVKENGKPPLHSKEEPSSWRTGLRKTPSFDEKSKLKSETDRPYSSYSSKYNDETKTARVAPILDSRKSKDTETEDITMNDTSSGYQRGTSFSRKKPGTDVTSNVTTTDATSDSSSSFKRRSVTEATASETTEEATAAAAAIPKFEDAEKRRSHLQPVRDEEAETQRKRRSRLQRQARRSTQGVTLDVFEEAMRTIGQLKNSRSGDKTDSSNDTTKSQNDTSSSVRLDSTTSQSGSGQSSYSSNTVSGTSVTSLPSSYVPSNQRVKASESNDVKTSSLPVPSITVDPTVEVEDDKGDNSPSENGSSAVQNRRSAAQQRRRQRSQRRSTGLPDLQQPNQPTESETMQNTTGPTENEGEEFEFNAKVVSDSPRFRRRRISHGDKHARPKVPAEFSATTIYASDKDRKLLMRKGLPQRFGHRSDNKSRPRLPDMFQATEVYKSETVVSSKPPIAERIKKLVKDDEDIDDDERHRRFVERLSSRIKKRNTIEERDAASGDKENLRISDEITNPITKSEESSINVMREDSNRIQDDNKEDEDDSSEKLVMEFDDPPIPTMRKRLPLRSNLVSMFASELPAEINTTEEIKTVHSQTNANIPVQTAEEIPTPTSIEPIEPTIKPTKIKRNSIPKPLKVDSVIDSDVHEKLPMHSDGMASKIIAACIVGCVMSVILYYVFF